MTTIKLDGNTLSSTEISLVANGAKVEVAIDAWGKVELARDVVNRILNTGEIVYGINTGFGALAEVAVEREDLNRLQRNLVLSHAELPTHSVYPKPCGKLYRKQISIRVNSHRIPGLIFVQNNRTKIDIRNASDPVYEFLLKLRHFSGKTSEHHSFFSANVPWNS